MNTYDIAVVGYGPTGLMMAALMAQAGHKVLVLERWPQLYGRARLTHIDGETVRLLSVACDIEAAMRDSSPIHSFTFLNARGRALLDVASIPSTPMGHPDHNSIFQPNIEDALDARVKSFANATVLQGCRVTALRVEDAGVVLSWQDASGATAEGRARYVFGADGANSFVREAIGIDREDSGFNERWLNVDGQYSGSLDPIYAETVQHCDPARGRMSMPIGTNRRRFEFGLKPGENTEDMENDATVARLLKTYFDVDIAKLRIDRKVVYQFECRTATSWRKGPVFLGGDAAHTMPPYLGQGACSGIRDAANLAWKMDLVLRGLAPDPLLDSYEPERRPHVAHIQKAATSFGKIANTHSRVAAFLRDLVFRLNILPPPPPFPPLATRIAQPADGRPFAKGIGHVPPHGRVMEQGSSDWFDHLAGYAFSVVGTGAGLSALGQPQREALSTLGANLFVLDDGPLPEGARRLDDIDARFTGFLSQQRCTAMILRPDTALFGMAQTPDDMNPLVDALRTLLSEGRRR